MSAAPLVAENAAARRQFLRILGGVLLAVFGGAAFVAGGTVINEGGLESPVNRRAVESAGEPDTGGPAGPGIVPTTGPEPTDTPATASQAEPSPTPAPAEPAEPTDTPATAAQAEASPTAGEAAQPEPTATPESPSSPTKVPPIIKVDEITPTESFYHVSKNFFDPSPSADGWRLAIGEG